MKKYYECHITMLGKPEELKEILKGFCSFGIWKFSAIDGDPDLGEGVKCYLTTHRNIHENEYEIQQMLTNAAAFLQDFYEVKVLRTKIEMVVYDDRSWKNEEKTCQER